MKVLILLVGLFLGAGCTAIEYSIEQCWDGAKAGWEEGIVIDKQNWEKFVEDLKGDDEGDQG